MPKYRPNVFGIYAKPETPLRKPKVLRRMVAAQVYPLVTLLVLLGAGHEAYPSDHGPIGLVFHLYLLLLKRLVLLCISWPVKTIRAGWRTMGQAMWGIRWRNRSSK